MLLNNGAGLKVELTCLHYDCMSLMATPWHAQTYLSMQYTWCLQERCLTNYQDFTCKLPLLS